MGRRRRGRQAGRPAAMVAYFGRSELFFVTRGKERKMRCSRNLIGSLLAALTIALSGCKEFSANTPDDEQSADMLVVLRYCPAMGQFVNLLPRYETGDTEETMCRKAEQSLRNREVITLGGFGGYVVLSLSQPIYNNTDRRDLRIYGNAFLQAGNEEYGNSEPGIVLVSQDLNGNGIADDEWYELAGSEYFKSETTHNYSKVWHKSDTTLNNIFHTQPYFPLWLTDSIIEVSGTLLASHAVITNGVVAQQVLDYGYVDNKANTDLEGISFDLDWAVDAMGNKVELTYCDFVKVQTAVDEVFEQIGELSTEVAGIERIE